MINDQILALLFLAGYILLQGFWDYLDPRTLKERLRWYLKPHTLFFAFLAFFSVVIVIKDPRKFQFDWNNLFLVIFGTVLYILGFIISIWARATMRKNWLPAGEGHDIKRQPRLITDGPFKYSRNPIYVGLTLLYFGALLALRTYLIFVPIIFFWYYHSSVVQEEKNLERYFGKKYLEYKKKTPRYIGII